MQTSRQANSWEGFTRFENAETEVLDAKEERALLRRLAEYRGTLAEALSSVDGAGGSYAGSGPSDVRLGAVFRRYREARGTLAMANLRLVAHIAKAFRDRGVSYADLLQEGFCGLLEAIDRFDLNRETKLATYATWWIRQAIQHAVAAGAYPVRLTPRHLRQLAQCQEDLDVLQSNDAVSLSEPADRTGAAVSSDLIHRIYTATRPTLSLDAAVDSRSSLRLVETIREPEDAVCDDLDREETVSRLLEALRPREQEVMALRFGLGGKPGLSLSQVGKVMEVSKERVRQIQDRALEKLRAAAAERFPGSE